MNAKHGFAGAVLLVLLVAPLVGAQTPQTLPFLKDQTAAAPPMDAPPTGAPNGLTPLPSPTALPNSPNGLTPLVPAPAQANSPDALYYPQPWQPSPLSVGCCGPTGGCGPITYEIYGFTGLNFLVSNTPYAKAFNDTWEIGGGGRSLFFNKEGDAAWLINLDIIYDYNDGHQPNAFNFQGNPVTMRNLDRTAVGVGLGHDWFLCGPGVVGSGYEGVNFRYGVEAGARWGTQHVDMNIIGTDNGYLRSHDLIGEAYARLHLDAEVPMGGWMFFAGVSGGYTYTFGSNVLGPFINTDLQEINLLFHVGVRY